jgi:putative oxidoreductase
MIDVIKPKLMHFGPLPIRILAGTAFIIHGYPKFGNISGIQGFMGSLGVPGELALPLAILETLGGVLLILGVLTRVSGILLAIEMTLTSLIVKLEGGFLGGQGQPGFEVDLLLMAMVISLVITGPGRVSIEWDVIKREIFPRGKALVPTSGQQQS